MAPELQAPPSHAKVEQVFGPRFSDEAYIRRFKEICRPPSDVDAAAVLRDHAFVLNQAVNSYLARGRSAEARNTLPEQVQIPLIALALQPFCLLLCRGIGVSLSELPMQYLEFLSFGTNLKYLAKMRTKTRLATVDYDGVLRTTGGTVMNGAIRTSHFNCGRPWCPNAIEIVHSKLFVGLTLLLDTGENPDTLAEWLDSSSSTTSPPTAPNIVQSRTRVAASSGPLAKRVRVALARYCHGASVYVTDMGALVMAGFMKDGYSKSEIATAIGDEIQRPEQCCAIRVPWSGLLAQSAVDAGGSRMLSGVASVVGALRRCGFPTSTFKPMSAAVPRVVVCRFTKAVSAPRGRGRVSLIDVASAQRAEILDWSARLMDTAKAIVAARASAHAAASVRVAASHVSNVKVRRLLDPLLLAYLRRAYEWWGGGRHVKASPPFTQPALQVAPKGVTAPAMARDGSGKPFAGPSLHTYRVGEVVLARLPGLRSIWWPAVVVDTQSVCVAAKAAREVSTDGTVRDFVTRAVQRSELKVDSGATVLNACTRHGFGFPVPPARQTGTFTTDDEYSPLFDVIDSVSGWRAATGYDGAPGHFVRHLWGTMAASELPTSHDLLSASPSISSPFAAGIGRPTDGGVGASLASEEGGVDLRWFGLGGLLSAVQRVAVGAVARLDTVNLISGHGGVEAMVAARRRDSLIAALRHAVSFAAQSSLPSLPHTPSALEFQRSARRRNLSLAPPATRSSLSSFHPAFPVRVSAVEGVPSPTPVNFSITISTCDSRGSPFTASIDGSTSGCGYVCCVPARSSLEGAGEQRSRTAQRVGDLTGLLGQAVVRLLDTMPAPSPPPVSRSHGRKAWGRGRRSTRRVMGGTAGRGGGRGAASPEPSPTGAFAVSGGVEEADVQSPTSPTPSAPVDRTGAECLARALLFLPTESDVHGESPVRQAPRGRHCRNDFDDVVVWEDVYRATFDRWQDIHYRGSPKPNVVKKGDIVCLQAVGCDRVGVVESVVGVFVDQDSERAATIALLAGSGQYQKEGDGTKDVSTWTRIPAAVVRWCSPLHNYSLDDEIERKKFSVPQEWPPYLPVCALMRLRFTFRCGAAPPYLNARDAAVTAYAARAEQVKVLSTGAQYLSELKRDFPSTTASLALGIEEQAASLEQLTVASGDDGGDDGVAAGDREEKDDVCCVVRLTLRAVAATLQIEFARSHFVRELQGGSSKDPNQRSEVCCPFGGSTTLLHARLQLRSIGLRAHAIATTARAACGRLIADNPAKQFGEEVISSLLSHTRSVGIAVTLAAADDALVAAALQSASDLNRVDSSFPFLRRPLSLLPADGVSEEAHADLLRALVLAAPHRAVSVAWRPDEDTVCLEGPAFYVVDIVATLDRMTRQIHCVENALSTYTRVLPLSKSAAKRLRAGAGAFLRVYEGLAHGVSVELRRCGREVSRSIPSTDDEVEGCGGVAVVVASTQTAVERVAERITLTRGPLPTQPFPCAACCVGGSGGNGQSLAIDAAAEDPKQSSPAGLRVDTRVDTAQNPVTMAGEECLSCGASAAPLLCGHVWCLTCLEAVAAAPVDGDDGDGGGARRRFDAPLLWCPQSTCCADPLPVESLSVLKCSAQMLARYEDALVRLAMRRSKTLRECTKCGQWAAVLDPQLVACGECGHMFCGGMGCTLPPHWPHKCDTVAVARVLALMSTWGRDGETVDDAEVQKYCREIGGHSKTQKFLVKAVERGEVKPCIHCGAPAARDNNCFETLCIACGLRFQWNQAPNGDASNTLDAAHPAVGFPASLHRLAVPCVVCMRLDVSKFQCACCPGICLCVACAQVAVVLPLSKSEASELLLETGFEDLYSCSVKDADGGRQRAGPGQLGTTAVRAAEPLRLTSSDEDDSSEGESNTSSSRSSVSSTAIWEAMLPRAKRMRPTAAGAAAAAEDGDVVIVRRDACATYSGGAAGGALVYSDAEKREILRGLPVCPLTGSVAHVLVPFPSSGPREAPDLTSEVVE